MTNYSSIWKRRSDDHYRDIPLSDLTIFTAVGPDLIAIAIRALGRPKVKEIYDSHYLMSTTRMRRELCKFMRDWLINQQRGERFALYEWPVAESRYLDAIAAACGQARGLTKVKKHPLFPEAEVVEAESDRSFAQRLCKVFYDWFVKEYAP